MDPKPRTDVFVQSLIVAGMNTATLISLSRVMQNKRRV